MKTGRFIKAQYDREISRILQELEIAKEKIKQETEILDLQSKVRSHAFIQSGPLVVRFYIGGSTALAFEARYFEDIFSIDSSTEVYENKDREELQQFLSKLHLKKLKACHPKMADELLRRLAKREFLKEEDEEYKEYKDYEGGEYEEYREYREEYEERKSPLLSFFRFLWKR